MKKHNKEQVRLKGDNSSLISTDEYNLIVLGKQESLQITFINNDSLINKSEGTKEKSKIPHYDKSLYPKSGCKVKNKKKEKNSLNRKKNSIKAKSNKESFPKSISKKGFKKSKHPKNNRSNNLYSFEHKKSKSFSSGYSCTDYSKLYGGWGYSGGKCSPK
ncbi:TPA: hypothetical protein ACX6RC_000588 [Photobacterium damselae]|uniref:hypothetical protein n=1 Tax=Photobacterium damselae TaxID=38293 RepID=UPI003C6E665C